VEKRVWREIDTVKTEHCISYAGDKIPCGMFIEILIDAIKRGKIKAYKSFDDRFTTIMTKEDIMESVAGK